MPNFRRRWAQIDVGQIRLTQILILCSAAKLLEKTPFSVSAPSPLLPSPASLQLAQLQAQLTLHRLKLAQTAVTNNPAAATVLNQVLSKVAMSQPLFNQLRHPTVMNAPQGHAAGPPQGPSIASTRFPSSSIAFPAQTPALAAPGGGLGPVQAQTPNAIVMSPFGGVMAPTSSQQSVVVGLNKAGASTSAAAGGFYEYNKQNTTNAAPQAYASEGDQPSQHGFLASGAHTASSAVGPRYEGHFGAPSQLQHEAAVAFPKEAYGVASAAQHGAVRAFPSDPHAGSHPKGDPVPVLHGSSTSNQWENVPNFPSQNKPNLVPGNSLWPSASQQQYEIRNELYNPEEPTPDTKFSAAAPPAFGHLNHSKQSFSSPRMRQKEERSSGASDLPARSLPPHQLGDLHGAAPLHFPHVCALCDKKIFDLKVSGFKVPPGHSLDPWTGCLVIDLATSSCHPLPPVSIAAEVPWEKRKQRAIVSLRVSYICFMAITGVSRSGFVSQLTVKGGEITVLAWEMQGLGWGHSSSHGPKARGGGVWSRSPASQAGIVTTHLWFHLPLPFSLCFWSQRLPPNSLVEAACLNKTAHFDKMIVIIPLLGSLPPSSSSKENLGVGVPSNFGLEARSCSACVVQTMLPLLCSYCQGSSKLNLTL